MENWEKYVLRDLITFIVEEEVERTEMVSQLKDLGISVDENGTGRKALERVFNNTEKGAVNCEDANWWLNAIEFIQPKYKRL